MVLTVRMRHGGQARSRRELLRLAGGVLAAAVTAPSLAGCEVLDRTPSWHVGADPLVGFHRATLDLLARYEATIAARSELAGRLGPLRDDHAAHAEALSRELALPSGADPGPVAGTQVADSPTAAVAALRTLEQAALAQATQIALSAPTWVVALLGSIAACRASHLEVLK